MPEEALSVIGFLVLGYLLFVVEIIVPGGILGMLGLISVAYGCWLAFDLGAAWGAGSIVVSLVVFVGSIRFLLHSKTGKSMTLQDHTEAATWKSGREEWQHLVGREGVAVSDLRPSGIGTFGNERLDIVSDSALISAGTPIRVVEVEGRRILVEPVEGWDDAAEPAADVDADATADVDADATADVDAEPSADAEPAGEIAAESAEAAEPAPDSDDSDSDSDDSPTTNSQRV